MSKTHFLGCLLGAGLVALAAAGLGHNFDGLGVLAAALVCPVMMVLMLSAMGRDSSCHHDGSHESHGHERDFEPHDDPEKVRS